MLPALWNARAAPWAALAIAAVGVAVVTLFVDVSPKVEAEFFFAEDDPQMEASARVRESFPAAQQLILRVADLEGDGDAYLQRVGELTEDLLSVDGVRSAFSIATNDPSSPLFGPVLLTRDANATNIIVEVDDTDAEILLPRVEEVVAAHEGDALEVVISGVPAIIELIRRSLDRDLAVFSLAAIAVFSLLIGLVYRDLAIVVGTMATCFASVSLTLVVSQAMGVPIGLLTANLVTIVFVLTLSHIVFLTANWRRAGPAAPVAEGVRRTLEPSFWSMTTTLLGFLSLLIATARPLRELGVAGAIGTVTALAAAFTLYPCFLAAWARSPLGSPAKVLSPAAISGRLAVPVVGVVVVALGLGIARLDTDPPLPSYFAEGSEIRVGIDEIDLDGGTSTLDAVVADPAGGRVDALDTFAGLAALQSELEADPAVGVVLSPSLIVAHARTIPFAGLLPVAMLLDIASSDRLGGVGLGYVTADRDQARFAMRIHESRAEPRDAVIGRVEGLVRGQGLEPVVIAGLYQLQAELGRLIASSLRIGIGGLLVLFLGVGFVVARSGVVALKMWACLAAIPAVVLGLFGHLGVAVDIITSPAANIALAMGADSMIHLVVRVRTLEAAGLASPWSAAVSQMRRPILGATGIIGAGFGIFVLSSFPPTQRFGLAVILGSIAAATMALFVLPRMAAPAPGGPVPTV